MSPTYPSQTREDIRQLVERIAECDPAVIFHEPINPRGANFEMTVQAAKEAGEADLADQLAKLRDREYWVKYAIRHLKWVQEIGEEVGVPIHLWPDKELVKLAASAEAEWLQAWRDRQSPERFATRSPPNDPLPKYPDPKPEKVLSQN